MGGSRTSSEPEKRRERTRAGCITCKQRKKKCDEVKPRCAGCRRNQLVCEWPAWVFGKGVSTGHDGGHSTPGDIRHSGMELDSPMSTITIPAPVPVLHAGSKRPCTLTPQSVILLGHYLAETAGSLAMTPLNRNPFVTILLPLGHEDDLLMHGLLAVSGAHMTYREANNNEVAQATTLHYSTLVSQLRVEFSGLREHDMEKKERLLRVLLVLCQYEAVAGDMHGNIFSHLRAVQHLLTSISELASTDAGAYCVNQETLGLSMEWYAYLVSCNTFTPHGLTAARDSSLDTFTDSMSRLNTFPTFGVFFAGCHELHSLVPTISLLASRRLKEEAAGATEVSEVLCHEHNHIHSCLDSWTMPPVMIHAGGEFDDVRLRQYASEALRHALYIYLATSLAGATVTDPAVRALVSQHVRAVFAATPHLIASRRYIASILWPVLVAASCLATPAWQEVMLREMCGGWFQMRQLEAWKKVLTLLYEDSDPRAYGPYGLYLMMEKHGLNVANA